MIRVSRSAEEAMFALHCVHAVALAAVFLSSGLNAAPAPKDRLSSEVDRFIESELKKAPIPGLSVAVVRNGQILLTGGYGVRSEATAEPMTEETLVDLASVSKSFSAVAIRQLKARTTCNWIGQSGCICRSSA